MRELTTADDVVLALGGNRAVAQLLGARGAEIDDQSKRVSDWRHRAKRFPPDTFLILQAALEAAGKSAPARLWNMREPARKRRAAA